MHEIMSLKNNLKCSLWLLESFAFISTLMFLTNLFLNPLLSSFPFLFREKSSVCVKSNVSSTFPWKAEIGQWLSECHPLTKQVNISEIIWGKTCKDDCNGFGVCNREFGQCRCFHGYTGETCSDRLNLSCNYPATPNMPYGRWVVSICSAHCDTTRAMCFCGEGSKYPQRPVLEHCSFKDELPTKPGGLKRTDFTKTDPDIYTTNGWCNVDPSKAYDGEVNVKEECNCNLDGWNGRFCEIPVEPFCINQCSGNGHCRNGFCQCYKGWYGSDCSMPAVETSVTDWPEWLFPGGGQQSGEVLRAFSLKKRPLIYVYDLPPEFNSLLLEGRIDKNHCANRVYNDMNETEWTNQIYGAQMAIYESILGSKHRTTNGDEADYFFVPVLDSCIIARAFETPYFSKSEPHGFRSHMALEFYKKAYDHISEQYPFWNRSSGKDHIWSFSWDEGPCYAPKEIRNSIMVAHFGNTNTKHKNSTTAYEWDNWDTISEEKRGNYPCFDPTKDLLVPTWMSPNTQWLAKRLWKRPLKERKILFYFNGNLGPSYPNGRPEAKYSMGIREKVAEEFGSVPNKDGELGKQHEKDVVVTYEGTPNYAEELANSVFCGVLPGDGWSGRMIDCVLHGSIPVVIQNGVFLPLENVLNFESYSVRVTEDDIQDLIKILRGIDIKDRQTKKANLEKVWRRYKYRDDVMMEAKRQEKKMKRKTSWGIEYLKLANDDVFETLIQVLHYKLHNDPWRHGFSHQRKKDYGLPLHCFTKRDTIL